MTNAERALLATLSSMALESLIQKRKREPHRFEVRINEFVFGKDSKFGNSTPLEEQIDLLRSRLEDVNTERSRDAADG